MKLTIKLSFFLLLALILLACRNNGPAPNDPDLPLPGEGSFSGAKEYRAAPEDRGREPSKALAPPPAVGGVVGPAESQWLTALPTDPLGYLLHRSLHRSLLDARTATPSLAAGWSMEGSRATFTLAPDLAWSDGTPMRAGDIATRLRQAAGQGELVGLQEVRVLDDLTLEVELAAPLCPSLMRVATWPIIDAPLWPPARTSGRASVKQEGEQLYHIGPGLFRYSPFSTEVALREAWEAGRINSILGASRLTLGPLPGAEPSQEPGPLLATLLFRLEESLLQDGRLREALTLATDRAALFREAYGFEPPALLSALLPSGHWAAPVNPLPVDRDAAVALLEQSGWRDRNGDGVRENEGGTPLHLGLILPLSSDQRWEALGRGLAEQWATVGVRLEPLYLESYSLQEYLHTERWQVALLAYSVGVDPDQQALWSQPASDDLVGNDLNVTGYHHSGVAELMAQGAQLPGCLPEERALFYREAWQQLLVDRPLWPLFPLPLDEMHRPGVEWPAQGR